MTAFADNEIREGEGLSLPDPVGASGPLRPFTSDPGWREAWWWLGVPLAVALFLTIAYAISPQWYLHYVLPEGYGVLELSHFFIPLAAFFIGLKLLFRPFVKSRPIVLVFVALATLACFYIAGEEHSWGQHFFNWQTPETWSEFNRQNETNLHNTLNIFDKTPRLILEIGIVMGGLIIPVLALFYPFIRRNRFSLFLPAAALIPTALGAMLFKLTSALNNIGLADIVARPSEAAEVFYYLFLLWFLITFARRIRELEAEQNSAGKV